MDISADLSELAKTPVYVISAGVKAILDIPKTLEYLETVGVPVTAYGQDAFPNFYTADSGCKAEFRADTPEDCAKMIKQQMKLGLETGMIFANPIPKDLEANADKMESAIQEALKKAKQDGITGAKITPFMLRFVAERTGGESATANVALIKNNAALGAKIAVSLSKMNA